MKVREAFNDYACLYDDDFTHTSIGKAQRKQVWRKLDPFLKPGMEVLEINCGTGEDAVELGKRGLQVTATDISDNMIEKARAKMHQTLGKPDMQFFRMGFEEIRPGLINQQFDLVFSNFGGLNCLSPQATRQFSLNLAQLVKPSGILFLVYLSKYCFWERAYHFWSGDEKKGRRRSRPMPLKVPLGKEEIDVWYTACRETIKWYAPHFTFISAFPIGLFVPPSYLEHFFSGHKRLLRSLEILDRFLALPLFTDYGDHQALVFKKNVIIG